MKFRPKGWPLPKPKAIHHIIENFFTEWHAPKIHIQPLRRFLEHCMQTDLRAFYAGKVFLTSVKMMHQIMNEVECSKGSDIFEKYESHAS